MAGNPVTPWFTVEGRRVECARIVERGPGVPDTVMFDCPRCERPFWLPHDVQFAEDGRITVTPSVVCPYQAGLAEEARAQVLCPNEACRWHAWITNGEASNA